MRLFAAISITPSKPVLELIHKGRLLLNYKKIRWANENQLHVTLKFFGETPPDKLPTIIGCLKYCSEQTNNFSFNLSNLGIFGSRYKPKVLWIGTSDDDMLRQLGEVVLDKADAAGFSRGRQNFVPHITLARINNDEHIPQVQNFVDENQNLFFQQVQTSHLSLYESILNPEGAKHILVEQFNFSH